ncbi:3-dehydroquinate synthase [Bizionia gelidisalsuginis]|uniref:3-dehydroquinate synthase n=2 Tax=Bizionia TaxID=283785 RepID=A0A8H2LFY3_9FLAO|nr:MULTISPECIES: 3-dehydroquinate synthase [Bizionia]TYB76747.1 3-dehydroquinate synthase [Bizionia saleffrena]TYC11979.1 3-dehydroquinate synthase [Bizionia gelidisalsuginis]
MISITTQNYAIHFSKASYDHLNDFLKTTNYSKLFFLVDNNTHNYCLPHFLAQIKTEKEIEIIEIEAGEIHKNIETCSGVWSALSELNADRKSLLINIGGGVVTDLGGFVASTFKRGIDFINVPTSLLAMVDASIGGKTGVDLGNLKNQIGVFNPPKMVVVDTHFLDTLPQLELRSGLAEMLKHGLIHNELYWSKLSNLPKLTLEDLDTLIFESIIIKKDIVEQDPNENNLRKTLNFGHTIGHAIESYYLSQQDKPTLLHGEAIAIGMVLATYISTKIAGFPEEKNTTIKSAIKSIYGDVTISENDYAPIIDLLKYDKKNEHGAINFVLLEDVGKPIIDCKVDNELIIKAFNFYNK